MDKSGGSGGGAAGGDSRDGGPSPTTTPPPAPSSSPAATAVGPSLGCGTGSSSSSSSTPAVTATPMTLNVTTTTGGSFSVVVDGDNSVENLKKIISKKLKVSKDRICLLHRERELHDGSLRDNGLMDGSKLILTPNVETGLLAQRAENTVMQALESLNDNQVNDFLSGKSPLNLSVRLGDHMMLIQLQLSTLNPSSQSGSRSKTHKSRTITGSSSSSSTSSSSSSSSAAAIASTSSSNLIQASSSRSSRTTTTIPIGFRRMATTAAESSSSTSRALVEHVNAAQTLTKQEIENIHSIVKNLAESGKQTVATVSSPPSTSTRTEPMETDAEPRFGATSESPIKSLSNLVSSSINANIPPAASVSDPSAVPICTDPISANLTSCLCKRLDSNDNNSCESNCQSRASPAPSSPQPSTSASVSNLHRTAQNPIMRHKSKVQTLKKHISFDGSTLARTEPELVQPVSSVSAPNSPQRPEQLPHHYQLHQPQQPGPSGTQTRTTTTTSTVLNTTPDPNSIENPALAEASRNLTQTLRKLSKRVFTNKVADVAAQEAARNVNSGAVIESMKHHGKGIYSGTFSGTLNPALQDKFGRPKRDISTIIHILNDLLSAAPQCARSGTKIYFEPSQSAASQSQSSSAATALTSGGSGSSAGASGGVLSGAAGSSQTTAANGMGASSSGTSFTTPVAAPSPRLVSRCVPTPIQTKKFPSNGTITSATIASGANGVATATGPTGSNCTNCTSTSSRTISLDPAVPSTSRSCYHHHHHHHHHHHQHHGHAHQQQKVTVAAGAAASAAPCKVLCKCGHPLAATAASTQCQRCAAISAAELENSKTKSKLDNLRLIMQQKKERREARKQKCAPYSTTTPPPSTSSAMVAAAAAAVGASGSTPAVVVPHRQPALTNTSASSSETSPESTTAAAIASDPGTSASAAAQESSVGGSSSAASSAATATATATTTTSATEAAQSHQLVEEVDTVA